MGNSGQLAGSRRQLATNNKWCGATAVGFGAAIHLFL